MTISKIIKKISDQEWLMVLGVSFFIIAISTTFLVYGFFIAPADSYFTGIHFSAPNDWFVYYSYIEQVKQGSILLDNLYTAEVSVPVLNPLWLGVGLVAKAFNLSPLVAFNLTRIVLIPIFLFFIYTFIAYFFADRAKRQLAFLLLVFSGGWGFLLLDRIVRFPTNFERGDFQWPMDLWVPEAFSFLTLYYSPHFIASALLLLLIFFLSLLVVKKANFFYSIVCGLSAFILFLFHPFHVITVLGTIFIYYAILILKAQKINWQLIKHYFILGLFSLPAIFYYVFLLRFDFTASIRALQNDTLTTPWWITAFSYGALLIFGIIGFYLLAREKKFSHKSTFVIIWVLVHGSLIYFPVNYQRRMTEGLQFPLVILTTVALVYLYNAIKKQQSMVAKSLYSQRYFVGLILIIAFSGSLIFQPAADYVMYKYRRGNLAYLNKQVVSAAVWLKNVETNKVVFNSADNIINIIPAFSGRKVYLGHGVETPFFGQKQQEVNWFFEKNRAEDQERQFLVNRRVDYIFYGPIEKQLGTYTPDNKKYLKLVFSNSQVKIFEVL